MIFSFYGAPRRYWYENLQSALTVLPSENGRSDYLSIPGLRLIEVAIPPRSHLAAQTCLQQKFGAKVLGDLAAGTFHSGTRLEKQPLEIGRKRALLQGTERYASTFTNRARFVGSAELGPPATISRRGWLTAFIMLTTLCLGGNIYLEYDRDYALLSAICMVLIGALSMDQT